MGPADGLSIAAGRAAGPVFALKSPAPVLSIRRGTVANMATMRERVGDSGGGHEAAGPAVISVLALIPALFLTPLPQGAERRPGIQAGSDPAALLAAVVVEVKELGRRSGEDFFRWEFFLGEDDDDTNKDTHAVVVIHDEPPPLRLRIHITDLWRPPGNPRVHIAGKTRVIFAARAGERLAIEKNDYAEKELVPVLRSLLKAIRDKKKLLRKAAERRLY